MAFLIAIEGIDGSGKGTQAAQLVESLESDGLATGLLSFPRYEETRFGQAIGDFLNGRFGSLDTVPPQLASLLFAGDRFESKPVIAEAMSEHDVLVCDRYVASNVAHQSAKLDDPERTTLMRWIESIEYDVYTLPRPDVTLLLDLPAAIAQEMIAKKSARGYTDKPADLQEADGAYLDRVRQVYLDLASADATWRCIDVMTGDAVRPIDEIATELRQLVRDVLTV